MKIIWLESYEPTLSFQCWCALSTCTQKAQNNTSLRGQNLRVFGPEIVFLQNSRHELTCEFFFLVKRNFDFQGLIAEICSCTLIDCWKHISKQQIVSHQQFFRDCQGKALSSWFQSCASSQQCFYDVCTTTVFTISIHFCFVFNFSTKMNFSAHLLTFVRKDNAWDSPRPKSHLPKLPLIHF